MRKFKTSDLNVKEVRTNFCPNLVEGECESPLVKGEPFTSRHEILMINQEQCNILLALQKNGVDVAYGSCIYNTREGDIEALMWDTKLKESSKLRQYVEGLINTFKVLNDIEYQRALSRPVQANDNTVKREKRNYNRKCGKFQRKGYYRHDKQGNLYYVRATVCLDNE